MKKRLITGITPTGNITLGNYAGAIKPMVEAQDDNEVVIFSADLHGITTGNVNGENLEKNTINTIALYLASGIDPSKSTIFLQSEIKEHTELSYLITCHLTYGELSRMTQYKDKSSKFKMSNGTEKVPAGLLFYPSLMAADILLYDADIVPVGKDQKQHIELTRDVANRINKKYGNIFTVPSPMISKSNSSKIMSLTDPTKKMSKSDSDIQGTIFLLDNERDVRKKIKSAITDSENSIHYDPENKPGVSNLIEIIKLLSGKSYEQIEKEFVGKHYGHLKDEVANEVVLFLNNIQQKHKEILESNLIDKVLDDGYKKVKPLAQDKILELKNSIGFYNRNKG
ncbi:MAG: tryptophan--tRNA ligase [Mycoplasmataceae bacterium]|nr:tryptophan--tRNA ligase [Mycoplasmataceae bacterium]